jgi:DNA-binding response OmpR family regulator
MANAPGRGRRARPEIGSIVLLVGGEAEALAPRLELSGHRPIALEPEESTTCPQVQAVIVAPDQEGEISRLRQRFAEVPLLLGIASDSVEGRIRCLASGADDYWLTSMGASDLLTRLRLHLGLSRAPGPAAEPIRELLQWADLVVNPATRRVQRGTRSVALTTREFELLLLLLRERGRVVSRERILKEVWQGETAAASNVIEVYVRYLRQKLEEGGERRLIHTVRGQGYCLGERLPEQEGGQRP